MFWLPPKTNLHWPSNNHFNSYFTFEVDLSFKESLISNPRLSVSPGCEYNSTQKSISYIQRQLGWMGTHISVATLHVKQDGKRS